MFEFYQNDRFQSRNPFTQAQPNATHRQVPPGHEEESVRRIARRADHRRTGCSSSATTRGARNTEGGSRLLTVPTAAARTGDLSAYGVNIYDPLTGVPAQRQQFAGQRHPGQPPVAAGAEHPRADPAAERRRDATAARATTTSRRTRRSSTRTRSTSASTAGSATARTLFGRYSRGKFLRDGPTAFGAGGGRELVSLGGVSDVKNQSLAYRRRHDAVADAAGRLPLRLVPLQRQRAAVRLRHARRRPDAGIPGLNLDNTFTSGLPAVIVDRTAIAGFNVGLGPRRQPLQLPARRRTRSSGSWSATSRRSRATTRSSSASTCGAPTTCACRATRTAPVELTFDAGPHPRRRWAAARASRPSCSATSPASPGIVSTSTDARERQWRHFYYAQDTWRATPKLTLNYGLRLDVINPQTVNEAGNGGLARSRHRRDPGRAASAASACRQRARTR